MRDQRPSTNPIRCALGLITTLKLHGKTRAIVSQGSKEGLDFRALQWPKHQSIPRQCTVAENNFLETSPAAVPTSEAQPRTTPYHSGQREFGLGLVLLLHTYIMPCTPSFHCSSQSGLCFLMGRSLIRGPAEIHGKHCLHDYTLSRKMKGWPVKGMPTKHAETSLFLQQKTSSQESRCYSLLQQLDCSTAPPFNSSTIVSSRKSRNLRSCTVHPDSIVYYASFLRLICT